jgi:2-dehydropantoate 2-reductase
MTALQRVAIVGAGAIGSLIGSRLAERLGPARVQLSALARGATLAALQARGLQCEGAAAVPVQAHHDAAALGPQDLVIVAVKAPALPAVASAVQRLLLLHTAVLVAMNGVPWWFFDHLAVPPGSTVPAGGLRLQSTDPTGTLRRHIPTAQVLGCVVHLSAALVAPGLVRPVGGRGLIVGEPAGGSSARVQAVAALLADAGFAVTVSERIQRDIWFKLWGNLTMNPVSALTGAPCDRILDDPLVRAFCSAVMLEAQAIGAAIGLPIEQTPEERHAVTRKLGSFKTSMLLDLEQGRPMEIDAIVSAVQETGRQLGLATPNTDALLGLVRLLAQQRGLYPGDPAGDPAGEPAGVRS